MTTEEYPDFESLAMCVWQEIYAKYNLAVNQEKLRSFWTNSKGAIPWHWKYNSTIFLYGSWNLSVEFAKAFSSMKASSMLITGVAKLPHKANYESSLTYYAHDFLYRVRSLWERIFFAYASLIKYIDPEEKYDYDKLEKEIRQSFKEVEPVTCKANLLKFLGLKGKKEWDVIKKFRNMIVHQSGIKISLGDSNNQNPIFYRLIPADELRRQAIQDFLEGYEPIERSKFSKEAILKGSDRYFRSKLINGECFERYELEQPNIDYADLETKCEICMSDLFTALYDLIESLDVTLNEKS